MCRKHLQCTARTMTGSVAWSRLALCGFASIVLLTSLCAGGQAFKEANGQVVMEGEDFAAADRRTDENNYEWRVSNTQAGYVGSGYVDTPGPQATNGTWDRACELTYEIDFSTAGTYSVWLRRYAISTAANSGHVGLDGIANGSYDNDNTPVNAWTWKKLGTMNVTAGRHIFNLRRREAEYRVDRIVLTTDSAFTPTGNGPAESQRGPQGKSSGGTPANAAMDVPRDVILTWKAGEFAQTHDVYFGTVFADVNTASRTSAKDALASQGQAELTFDVAGLSAYGQTHYWRVDEVNVPPSSTLFKGDVWSFTVEPYAYPLKNVTAAASSSQAGMGPEKTVDGSGLNSLDLHSTRGAGYVAERRRDARLDSISARQNL